MSQKTSGEKINAMEIITSQIYNNYFDNANI